MSEDGTGTVNSPGNPEWARRLEVLATSDVTPRRAALRRVAAAARSVTHGLAGADASTDELHDAAELLEQLSRRFAREPRRSMYEGFSESANAGDPHSFFDHSPMLGQANPLAPPIELVLRDDEVVEGRVRFGLAYEGPPGCVHGGYVAAGFDEVLGSAQSLSGAPGMTGRLTIHYRSPTPLHEDLVYTARFDRIDGRKVFTSGALYAGDRLCAEAEGLFISIDFTKFAALKADREASVRGTSSPDTAAD